MRKLGNFSAQSTPKGGKRGRDCLAGSSDKRKGKEGRVQDEPIIMLDSSEEENLDTDANRGISVSKKLDYTVHDTANHIEYEAMRTVDIMTEASRIIKSLENLRTRSKNLQGKVSGDMKRGHNDIKEILGILCHRLESRGDVSHLKKKNEKTEEENLALKTRLEHMEEEMLAIKEENKQLKDKIEIKTRSTRNRGQGTGYGNGRKKTRESHQEKSGEGC